MFDRMKAFLQFVRTFLRYAWIIREAMVVPLLIMVLGGFAIAKLEGIELGDAVYFAFITGLSIGYGDIAPKTGLGCVVSVGIGLVGMLFVGLVVAVATRALRDMLEATK